MNYKVITGLIVSQILLIFIHIYKHNLFIQHSFNLQKNEKTKEMLLIDLQNLENEWFELQKKSTVKDFAQAHLHMKPTKLSSLKKVTLPL
ncbi:MAG: hypothetical protein WA432_04950 [Candidatus Babeliaceae bacterium]